MLRSDCKLFKIPFFKRLNLRTVYSKCPNRMWLFSILTHLTGLCGSGWTLWSSFPAASVSFMMSPLPTPTVSLLWHCIESWSDIKRQSKLIIWSCLHHLKPVPKLGGAKNQTKTDFYRICDCSYYKRALQNINSSLSEVKAGLAHLTDIFSTFNATARNKGHTF